MSITHANMIVDGLHGLLKDVKDPKTVAVILGGILAASLKDEAREELIILLTGMRGRE